MENRTNLTLRKTHEQDASFFKQWLLEGDVLEGFPMIDEREVVDAINFWMHCASKGTSITVLYNKKPCGGANLYLQTIEKLKHQALFVILVDAKYRGQGIGTFLLKELMKKARFEFGIEILHLEVYDNNPAISLYKRLGFKEYGVHPKYLKGLDGTYFDKIMMQKYL